MHQALFVLLSLVLVSGCMGSRPSRGGIISQELPLTLGDLSEIRAGEQNHVQVMNEYDLLDSPKLGTYVNLIAESIGEVSPRPHLPYKVYLLESDVVNAFGGPGGYVYLTKGLLDFIQSEAELAGVIAHEMTHIAQYKYVGAVSVSKKKAMFDALVKGGELAADTMGGAYGSGAIRGIRVAKKAAPMITRRFGKDEEIEADKVMVEILLEAGYDPRDYHEFVERISKVEMDDITRFVELLNTHPPFQVRKNLLHKQVHGIDFTRGSIELRQDTLSEVRQMTVNQPDSILFNTDFEVTSREPDEIKPFQESTTEQFASQRKRWTWH